MLALRVILGVVAGLGIPFGSLYLTLHFGFNVGNATALGAASACGLIGAVYSGVASRAAARAPLSMRKTHVTQVAEFMVPRRSEL